MAFVLDTRLWGGLPLLPHAGEGRPRPPLLKLRVVYLEQPGAAFEVLYDSLGGCKTARAVGGSSRSGSARWNFIDVDLMDGRFGRGCITALGSADVVLRAGAPAGAGGPSRTAAAADAIISTIEIYDPARVPP